MTIIRKEFWWCALAFAAASVAWTLHAGQDVGWDLVNHQLYMPFSLLADRLHQDFFAAGTQSYLNPIGYLPFYLLAQTPLPGWLVGSTLAAGYGALVAWGLHRITVTVLGDAARDRFWRIGAIALALLTPIYLYAIGSSSNDPLAAGLVLLALSVALQAEARPRLAFLGGVALGLSLAVKLTSLVFALPVLALVLARLAGRQWAWRTALVFGIGTVVAFALTAGHWSWQLWQRFGNPFFPLFNDLFQSPYAPTGTIVALRFLPRDGLEWLTRLWDLSTVKAFVAVEAVMPDARPLLAAGAVLALGVAATWKRSPTIWLQRPTWLRPDVQLALLLLLCYGLWMATSGNARYAIAGFMLAPVLLVRAAQRFLRRDWATLLIALLAIVQTSVFIADGDPRPQSRPWSQDSYLPVRLPPHLADQPFLHLSLGAQTGAALAPLLHPDSAFVNLTGQLVLPTTGPLGDELARMLNRWKGRTRVLFAPRVLPGNPALAKAVEAESWALTHKVGLGFELERCEQIRIFPDRSKSGIGSLTLLSCPTFEQRRVDPSLDADLAQAERVFDAIETRCPRAFGPRPFASQYGPEVVWRRYMNSDVMVEVSKREGVWVSYFRSRAPVILGTIDEVIANQGRDACAAWKQLNTRE